MLIMLIFLKKYLPNCKYFNPLLTINFTNTEQEFTFKPLNVTLIPKYFISVITAAVN